MSKYFIKFSLASAIFWLTILVPLSLHTPFVWRWPTFLSHEQNTKSDFWVTLTDQFQLAPKDSNNHRVKQKIKALLSDKEYLTELTKNAQPYIFYIYQQVKKNHFPAEVAILPMIESSYDPFDFSRVGATGLWQLMPQLGSGFKLPINWWYDGRRDIITSTNASLKYLADLHKLFKDWLLTFAAYNAGEGAVLHAIHKNQKLGKPTNFWSLDLPAETKAYVPRLLALANILKNHQSFNIKISKVNNKPYFSKVTVAKPLTFQQIATLSNSNVKVIRNLNPGFRRWFTKPSPQQLLLPTNKVPVFNANLKNTPIQNGPHVVVIKPNTTTPLVKLAAEYNTKTAVIKEANHLDSNQVSQNKTLIIPVNHEAVPQDSFKKEKAITEDGIPGPKEINYTVQAKDTLKTIGHHYKVSPSDIYWWNGFNDNTKIKPGLKLILWASNKNSEHKKGKA